MFQKLAKLVVCSARKNKKSGLERRWKRNESVVEVLTAEAGKGKVDAAVLMLAGGAFSVAGGSVGLSAKRCY